MWPKILPLPDSTAPTIVRSIFDNWIRCYGVINCLHSDGCNNVDGQIMRELNRLLGVNKSHSPRLHPEGDGLPEAIIKITKSIILKHVDQHGTN